MKAFTILLSGLMISLPSGAKDSHPQLCENIRDQVSENCSEESNTMDENGNLVKRTYEECVSQDQPLKVQMLNEYLVNELGVVPYDSDYEQEEVSCDLSN